MKILHIGWGFTPWRPGGLIQYAEDLMQAQVAAGQEVAYFFSGRHYPFTRRPHLRRWRRHGVHMYELVNSEPVHAGDLGTLDPVKELAERASEEAFERVLGEWQPDLIHIQELAGLPSSLIEIAKSKDLAVLMTLHDYFLLCPTLKLLDYNGNVCLSKDVGDMCRTCCAKAPAGRRHLVGTTLHYEAVSHFKSGIAHKAGRSLLAIRNLLRPAPDLDAPNNSYDQPAPRAPLRTADAKDFQHRRDVNVTRLNKVDVLLSQSHRVAEIYQSLGVLPEKIVTLQSTLKHFGKIRPTLLSQQSGQVAFGTLNGCASKAKGSRLILEAVRKLHQRNLNEKFKLMIFGRLEAGVREDLLGFGNVEHKGFYDRNNLNSVLEGVDVGVVPSVWEEIYGYVGIEFLAKGIPVIGNKIGGIVDYVVPGQTGWLNAENSGEGLADIMASLIRSPEQIISMNRNIVANHDHIVKKMDVHVDEINAIYREVLARKGASATA